MDIGERLHYRFEARGIRLPSKHLCVQDESDEVMNVDREAGAELAKSGRDLDHTKPLPDDSHTCSPSAF